MKGRLKKEIHAPYACIQRNSIGVVGEAVTFDAYSSYDSHGKDIMAFHWDFGDGSTAKTVCPCRCHDSRCDGNMLQ